MDPYYSHYRKYKAKYLALCQQEKEMQQQQQQQYGGYDEDQLERYYKYKARKYRKKYKDLVGGMMAGPAELARNQAQLSHLKKVTEETIIVCYSAMKLTLEAILKLDKGDDQLDIFYTEPRFLNHRASLSKVVIKLQHLLGISGAIDDRVDTLDLTLVKNKDKCCSWGGKPPSPPMLALYSILNQMHANGLGNCHIMACRDYETRHGKSKISWAQGYGLEKGTSGVIDIGGDGSLKYINSITGEEETLPGGETQLVLNDSTTANDIISQLNNIIEPLKKRKKTVAIGMTGKWRNERNALATAIIKQMNTTDLPIQVISVNDENIKEHLSAKKALVNLTHLGDTKLTRCLTIGSGSSSTQFGYSHIDNDTDIMIAPCPAGIFIKPGKGANAGNLTGIERDTQIHLIKTTIGNLTRPDENRAGIYRAIKT